MNTPAYDFDKVTPEAWADALESGDYRQGPLNLYSLDTGKHCCLGVLAILAGYDNLTLATAQDRYTYEPIRVWLERNKLPRSSDFYTWNDTNDPEKKKSFKQIAAAIRQATTTTKE